MKKFFWSTLALLLFLHMASEAQTTVRADQLYNLNEKDPIDKIILEEARNLDSLVTFSQVWLTDQVATEYDPVFGVIINKKYVLRLANENHITDMRNFFRLIIAHEKMHARQYTWLLGIGRSLSSLTGEEKQRLECQADMCAGYVFLFPSIKQYSNVLTKTILYSLRNGSPTQNSASFELPNFSEGDSVLVSNTVRQSQDGINLFFSLGENDGVFGTHPTAAYRKEAFDMGVNAFFVSAMSYPLTPETRNSISPSEWQFMQTKYMMLNNTLGILQADYAPNGFFDKWSFRSAAKIIHLPNKASNNIVFKIKKNKWDPSSDHPFLSFEMDVINYNPDSVFVDMDIPIKIVSRYHPDRILNSRIATAGHAVFAMGPLETHKIVDSVIWTNSDSTMPSVFYPGAEGSVYQVYAIRPISDSFYMPPMTSERINLALLDTQKIEKLIFRLPAIQRSFHLFDLNYFKDGAGITYEGQEEITYNSYRGNEHFLLHVPIAEKTRPFLSCTVAKFDALTDAIPAYDQFKKELKELDDDYTLEERVGTLHNKAQIYNKEKVKIYTLIILNRNDRYELALDIFK